ncbi:hypothetical protein PV325_012653, partial [Microctonus aethiopoides]
MFNEGKFNKTLQKNLITCDVPQSSKSLELNSKISFEDLNNAMDLETTTTENDVHLKMQCCVDKDTQIDFLDLEINTNCNLLVCNRFVNIEACEAETETFLQFDTAGKNASVTSNTCDKLCGTDILDEDKCIGRDTGHFNSQSTYTCDNGFHGFSSITEESDLSDICKVKFAVFHLLLQTISHISNEKLSREYRLVLFLMKMKLGLTSAALGVIFGVHRTSASRIFKNILQILSTK